MNTKPPQPTVTSDVQRSHNGSYAISDCLFLSDRDVDYIMTAMLTSDPGMAYDPVTERSLKALLVFHKAQREKFTREVLARARLDVKRPS